MLKHAITLAASSVVFAVGLANSALAAPQDFVSNWVSTNPNTRGITRFAINLTGPNTLNIKVFEAGNCTPKFDCDQGTTKLTYYKVKYSKNQFARAEYNKGSTRTLLILNLSGVGPKDMSRRIILQRFTSDKSNQQRINSSQEIFMPTAQIWPMPSPCFFQDPRRCLTKPGWSPSPQR